MRSRYSARRFQPVPVPGPILDRLLELAQQTPSWCNTQPWQLVVTRSEGTERFRQALYAHARSGAPPQPDFAFPAAYVGVYRERRKVCGVQLYQALSIGREDKAAAAEQSLENFRFFGAPHVAIVTTDELLGSYGMLDCGLYVQTFMLRRADLGVDSIAQAALASLIRTSSAQFFGCAHRPEGGVRYFVRLCRWPFHPIHSSHRGSRAGAAGPRYAAERPRCDAVERRVLDLDRRLASSSRSTNGRMPPCW